MSNDLPQGWATSQLTTVVYFQEGPGLRKWQFGESGIPFLNIRTFLNGQIDRTKCQYVKMAEFMGKYEHFLLNEGDIVVSSSGTLGKLAIVRPLDLPLMLNTSTIRFRTRSPEFLTQDFLRWYLQSRQFFSQIETAKTGSAIFNYGPSHLANMDIVLPPIAEQERIVAKLEMLSENVRACRTRLERVPAILKRFRQAVFAAACSGRLTEDWRSSTSQQLAPVSTPCMDSAYFDEIDLPELPEKWVWTTIGALAAPEKNSITDGPFGSNLKTEHYTTIGPRVIRLQNIGDYRFVDVEAHISNQHFVALTKHQIRAGDVAIACLGDPVPRACLIPESVGSAVVKADCVRLKPNPEIAHKNYVCYVLNDSSTRARMSEIVHGVGRARLNLQQIKAIPVPLPPMAEQLEAVRRVESMLHLAGGIDRRVSLTAELSESLAQSILAKAFRGELVPTEAELARREGREYEPASALLERIKIERVTQTSQKLERKRTTPKLKLARAKG